MSPLSSTVPADLAWKRALRRRLLQWYAVHRRDLPWRRTAQAYPIWVSEIMLQQTQVATVIPYFERFIAAFPTVHALAAADEGAVLRLWEGLGYYRRARQLHRAAALVVETHAGDFPRDLAAACRLPGIGRYTAGAILSIAFDLRVPILEANTVRLLSRLVAFDGDATSGAGQRLLWQWAEALLPRRGSREFNQALMELGSLVCTPKSPDCERCPLAELCQARRRGVVHRIPAPKRKPTIEAVREAAVVVWRNDKLLIRQRTAGERWAGMWDFLRFELKASRGPALARELLAKVEQQSGLLVDAPRRVATLKHGVTRFRITLDCFTVRSTARRGRLKQGTWRWVRPGELENLPLSVTGRKLSRVLESVRKTPITT